MTESVKEIWITKFALTRGIVNVHAVTYGKLATYYDHGVRYRVYGDWYESEQEAKEAAESMLVKKVLKLKAKIEHLEALEFREEKP